MKNPRESAQDVQENRYHEFYRFQMVKEFKTLHTSFGQIELLTPQDCVKDRLASFFHWNDRQALEQAIMVLQDQKVNLKEIERWAKSENHLDKFKEFTKALKTI